MMVKVRSAPAWEMDVTFPIDPTVSYNGYYLRYSAWDKKIYFAQYPGHELGDACLPSWPEPKAGDVFHLTFEAIDVVCPERKSIFRRGNA